MLFFKIIQIFLYPSIFFLILILFGFLFKKKYLIILGLFFYYLFSITFLSDIIFYPLEKDYDFLSEQEMQKADKIVLLLGGKESDVLRASEVLRISHLSNHEKTIIISGTDPINPKSEEAQGVRNFFISRGIPQDIIIIEGQSRNTKENIQNVKEIVQEKPFLLVTSAYHLKRAEKEFEKVSANPIPAPTDFKRKGFDYGFFDFLPSSINLRNNDLAIKEYFGIFYYNLIK
ncbi:MAG: YdcF family protein [Candidatus Pacebacteria bacterium]|nr:YdcF family protein [Candidatus Paceibacterota bacterium]